MGANRTPIDKSMTLEKAIKQGGYYNTDGDWNCIVQSKDYPDKILRGRVETLIIKDDKLFMVRREGNYYRIPGGGFDKGVSHEDQAFMETKEEAKLIIDNIKFSGVTYTELYKEIWDYKEGDIPYHGTYNEVYVANYKEDFHGYIRKGLSDMELTKKGQFYDIDEVKDILKEPHKQALRNMFSGTIIESTSNELVDYALEFQRIILNSHKNGLHTYINNIDIEPYNGGLMFAEFVTDNRSDVKDLKYFVEYYNEQYNGLNPNFIIEEPDSYNGRGYLVLNNRTSQINLE